MIQPIAMKTEIQLEKIIEANLAELLDFRIQAVGGAVIISYYIEVLIAYLQSDLPRLNELSKTIPENLSLKEYQYLSLILAVRTQIRKRFFHKNDVEQLLEYEAPSKTWRAEGLFVAAMYYETKENNKASKDLYLRATQALSKVKCEKKSVRALLNYVVMESRLYPEKKLISDYLFIAKKAKNVGALSVSGVAYLNISREYQKILALELALKHCKLAIKELNSDHGSLHYYLSIVHRCHLYLEMGRFPEALLDYQRASISQLSEVRCALQIIDVLLKKQVINQSVMTQATPTWKERIQELKSDKNTKSLTQLEQKLVDLISHASYSKFDLMDALYSSEKSFTSKENRLKVLMSRFRKKCPGLLIRSEGKYFLADEVFLT